MNVVVRLDFSNDEHGVIQAHQMDELVIVPRGRCPSHCPGGECVRLQGPAEDLLFREFYGRKTSWHCDSAVEARTFTQQLDEGFKRFRNLLILNSSVPEEIRQNFALQHFDLSLVPSTLWSEHTYILGESGGGKTQLIQTLFLLHRQRSAPPGFFFLDSQNGMLPLIKERFPQAIHIDPENNPPHIDIFSLDEGRLDNASVSRLMDTFRYLFESGGEPLTPRQRTVFERGVALMFFGYPKGHGRRATIEDFEDFFEGTRQGKGRALSEKARKAVAALSQEERRWYETEFQNFDSTCTEILQRMANICGQYSPLRPMLTRGDKVDIGKAIDGGGIVLVNTNINYLGTAASAFMGRFFIKLFERHMSSRNLQSHPVFLVVDEVQEYFDSALMARFPDQARKRNVAGIFAHQRLKQVRDSGLYEALTGVAVRFATNVNEHDLVDAARIWRTEDGKDTRFIAAQQREQVQGEDVPHWADYALYVRGRDKPTSVRVDFFQLERLPERARASDGAKASAGSSRSGTEPPKSGVDYDLYWEKTISPILARKGGVFEFDESDGVPSIRVRPDTKHGATYRIREYGSRRPDGSFGDLYVTFNVPEKMSDREAREQKAQRGVPRGLPPGDSDDHTGWGKR